MAWFSVLVKDCFLTELCVLPIKLLKNLLKSMRVNIPVQFMAFEPLNCHDPVFVNCTDLNNFLHVFYVFAIVMCFRHTISKPSRFLQMSIIEKCSFVDVNNVLLINTDLSKNFKSDIRNILGILSICAIRSNSSAFQILVIVFL